VRAAVPVEVTGDGAAEVKRPACQVVAGRPEATVAEFQTRAGAAYSLKAK